MKVLHVIPAVAPRYGGPSAAVFGMCRALESRQTQTLVVTTDADGPGRLPVPTGRETEHEGISTVFFPRLDERFKYSPPLARWLARHASRFDVVHVHAVFSHSSVAAARACRRAGVPYVIRPLGSLDPWGLARHRLQKRLLRWAVVDRMLREASAVHFTTHEERRQAGAVVADLRGVVVPLGLDDRLLSEPVVDCSERDPVVVTIGRLHPVKNLEAVIEAFLQATRAPGRQPWRLVLAGEGDDGYRERLLALAGAAARDGRLSLPGWVRGEQKRALLDRAAVFVQVSHQESFGLSLAEAMARGVPPIVSRSVNLAGEIAEAGAGWIVDGSAVSIADALAMALADSPERSARAQNARRLAGSFSWSSVASDLQRMYDGVARAGVPGLDTAPDPVAAQGRGMVH